MGYVFELVSVSTYAIVIAVLSVCIIVFDYIYKNSFENKLMKILLAVVTSLSLVNAVFYIFSCPKITVISSVLFPVCCYCYLTVKHGTLLLKIVAFIISALMTLLSIFFCFIIFTFGNFGQNNIVKSIESPSGCYCARVIDSDQGALGGNTFVDLYQERGINVFLFKIKKKPQRVYSGYLGEYKNMKIYWKDDDCLLINSVEYIIE